VAAGADGGGEAGRALRPGGAAGRDAVRADGARGRGVGPRQGADRSERHAGLRRVPRHALPADPEPRRVRRAQGLGGRAAAARGARGAPGGARPGADRDVHRADRPGRVRLGDLRLPGAGPAGAAGGEPGGGAGAAAAGHRVERRGQVHADPTAAALPRPGLRRGPPRRHRHQGPDAAPAAQPRGADAAGDDAVRRHGAGEHRLRRPERGRRADRAGGVVRGRGRVHRAAAAGL
jgi:hypothetical protein